MAKGGQIAKTSDNRMAKISKDLLPMAARNRDLGLGAAVILIIALLVIPLPALMLDIFIATNLAISILILLVSLYLISPLEISSFPTILLITTLFRLGLNVASVRLILSEAHAGEIIKAFGTFVIKGNYIVGVIIFIILLVINFIVIIKGSTRIAEVAARFTLDSLPGKQMSIDADLNAGYIDEKTARKRRSDLTREADFYGAMDGASKFIRGDAIAGIIITAVNILGGFAIGVAQKGMDITNALSTYTILTIGDGLVSQIPALLISVAAGMVVTRSAGAEKLENEISKQFTGKPKALAMSSVSMLFIGLLPGFPMLPFFMLSAAIGGLAYMRTKSAKKEEAKKKQEEIVEKALPAKAEEAPVEDLLRVDPVEIELGYSLISLVDESQGGDVFKRITNVRKQLATELGIILPPVRVRDNLQLEPEEYVIKIRGNELARNILHPNMLLAMNPGTAEGDLHGISVTEPVFGLPAIWVQMSNREDAEIMGYTVVEAATVLTTHLTELLRRNAEKLITRQDVKHLVDTLKIEYPSLVEEMNNDPLPMAILQKVLQNLLKEGIPVRDLAIIVESLLEYYKVTKNVDVLSEYVRHNLSETIKKLYQDQNGVIHAVAVEPSLEQTITNALSSSTTASTSLTMGLAPDAIKAIQKNMADVIDEITLMGYLPIVICAAQIRPYFYRMIHTQYPMVSVISYTELPPDTDIEIHTTVKI